MGNFVHLHLHTEYSLLDGMARITDAVKKAKELGMPAIAMTDHGNMYGAIAFCKTCKEAEIKPIYGTEFYVCDDLTVHEKIKVEEGENYKDRRHLVILVKNEQGYKNISLLNAIAFRDGLYYKPRIDLKTLKEHSEGLICLSACLGGDIPQAILNRNEEKAEELVKWFKDVFKDDFYLELQNHGLKEQELVNSRLKYYAKKYDIKTVCTNDVHYINKEDAETHDILLCVQTRSNIDTPNRMRMPCGEFYFKSYEEMQKAFPDDEEALQTTLEIADKCNFAFTFGDYMFPHYKPENGMTPMEFIRMLIKEGVDKKLGGVMTKEVSDRIEMELSVIDKQGFIEYYLIVWDYIHAARRMGISVGPGRGSGAGSMVAYLIDITDIDPLKYELYFERFLNAERVSAPDFDVDFEDSRRQEVIEYVKQKYGADSVAKIITFGTMAAKNAIKDVGRVLHIPLADCDRITKLIPNKISHGKTTVDIKRPYILKKVFGRYIPNGSEQKDGLTTESFTVPELVQIYDDNPDLRRVIDTAMELEDMPRQSSTHACGVIIGADILDKHMPLSSNDGDITSQYTGSELESLGFLKMDFLGLRNLSDIKMCIEYVKQNYGVEIDFSKLGVDDSKVYDLISSGNTTAIFQIESGGFKDFLSKLKPTCLEDIVAAVSLFRPGPMDSIPKFIECKHNPDKISYAVPQLEPILKQTYGCIVYQEQVMKIVQVLAGYTLGQADNVRRMMGKKKVEAMAKEQMIFLNGKAESVDKDGKVSTAIDGCLKRGIPEKVAVQIWDEMKNFAKYAFNKSHAAAYSLVTYQTAYLKCYYEPEFLTAVLNNRITNIDEITNYVSYAKEEGIPVLQPDINESVTYFSVKNKTIRFGLAAVKNVGIGAIDSIIKEREEKGKFTSFEDFCQRCVQYVNKRLVENLIFAGAFDSFGVYRSRLICAVEEALEMAQAIYKQKESNQLNFFSLLGEEEKVVVHYQNVKEYEHKQKLLYEKSVSGVYITGHPLEKYADVLKGFSFSLSRLLNTQTDEDGNITYVGVTDGEPVEMGGIITNISKKTTKSGQSMAFITIEDIYTSADCVLFPKVYDRCKDYIIEDEIVKISGKLQVRDGDKPSIIVDKLSQLKITTDKENAKEDEIVVEEKKVTEGPKHLLITLEDNDKKFKQDIIETIAFYPGDIDVYLRIDGKNYKLNSCCRKCKGLMTELTAFVDEKNIKFI